MSFKISTKHLPLRNANMPLAIGSVRVFFLSACFFCISISARAQSKPDTTLTLTQCIEYALQHQPGLQKAQINQSITKATNAVNLSAWLPQVGVTGDAIHYFQRTTNVTNGTTAQSSGYANSFIPELAVNQAIFNPNLLYLSRTAPLLEKQSQQATDSTKINIVSTVTKTFYSLLLNLEQINVLKEDTARLGKNVQDTYHQYVGGIVDETDYEEATITLNNSVAQLKQATENVAPEYASLKQVIGYPVQSRFNVSFDTLQMVKGIGFDTTQQLQFEKRIEFQELNTERSLQNHLIDYYRTSFLPTVGAFFNYNLAFQSNTYSDLFASSYPSSLIGVSISIPVFTGFARINNLKKARLQEQVLDWDEVDLKSSIFTEYKTALANYKGNLYNLELLQKNVTLAKRVYFVVGLQYKQGIVPYLNVITAESNLITSEINYLNALFQVLSNKIDLQRSMGLITY